jgi:hypothetical protein
MARRCRTLAATVVLALVVACGGAASSSDGSAPASAPSDASTLPILQHVRTGAGPIGIKAAFGSIWVVNSEFRVHDRGSVTRVDGGRLDARDVRSERAARGGVGGRIDRVSNSDDAGLRIDGPNTVVATMRLSRAGLAGTPGSVGRLPGRWHGRPDRPGDRTDDGTVDVESPLGSRLARSEPLGLELRRRISVTDRWSEGDRHDDVESGPQLMLAASGGVWVSNTDAPAVRGRADQHGRRDVAGRRDDARWAGRAGRRRGSRRTPGPGSIGSMERTRRLAARGRSRTGARSAQPVAVAVGGTFWVPLFNQNEVVQLDARRIRVRLVPTQPPISRRVRLSL